MNNLYLTGMMGSGKSATGRQLAALLKRSFLDLDERIREKAGRTINDIFAKDGESFFRDLESATLKEATEASESQVVATGGGIILRDENVRHMKARGKIVYLETSSETLWERVRYNKDRPLLKQKNPREALEKILTERRSLYESTGDFRIVTDGKTALQVARDIMETIEAKP